jgi:hypothetical protein
VQCPDKITIHAAEGKRHGQQGVNCKPLFLPQAGACMSLVKRAGQCVAFINRELGFCNEDIVTKRHTVHPALAAGGAGQRVRVGHR